MDIQIIREFLDLSKTLNYRKTAIQMYISQPALSKHIMSLEKELGVPLFIRNKTGIELTEAGKEFVVLAGDIIRSYDNAFQQIRRNHSDILAVLKIGFLDSAVHFLLPKFLDDFRTSQPYISLALESCDLQSLNLALENNDVDIGFCIMFPNSSLSDEFHFIPLYDDGISAVVPENHPLSTQSIVSFKELFQYPLILPGQKQFPVYASLITRFIASSAIPVNIICDYLQIDTALIMVESNIGVSVMPTNTKKDAINAKYIPISDCDIKLQVGLLYKKAKLTKELSFFIDSVLTTMKSLKI